MAKCSLLHLAIFNVMHPVQSHHLAVIENAIGDTLKSGSEVTSIFSKLSWSQLDELEDALIEFETHWTPPKQIDVDTMHIGRAFYALNKPKSWIPSQGNVDGPFDAEMVARMLIYLPRVSVWLPEIRRDEFGRKFGRKESSVEEKTRSRACRLAVKLCTLRPFLDDGSFMIVPDRFYADFCKWNAKPNSLQNLKQAVAKSTVLHPDIKTRVANSTNDDNAYLAIREQFGEIEAWLEDSSLDEPTTSDMLLLARQNSLNNSFREVLDQFDFFEGAEELCSDSKYIWGLREAEFIKYINPLNEINEDKLIGTYLNASTLCNDARMFELLKRMDAAEAVKTNETTWANASVLLPGLSNISVNDLVSIRRNEEAFEVWRTTLSRAMRNLKSLSAVSDPKHEAKQIFCEEIQPVSMGLQQKIKSKSIKAALKGGAVSFGSGAAASYTINPNPTVSIATGAMTSMLKIMYDIFESRGVSKDRTLVRMFSVLTGL